MKGSLNAVDWNLKNTIRHFPKFIANTGLTSKDEKLVKKLLNCFIVSFQKFLQRFSKILQLLVKAKMIPSMHFL